MARTVQTPTILRKEKPTTILRKGKPNKKTLKTRNLTTTTQNRMQDNKAQVGQMGQISPMVPMA